MVTKMVMARALSKQNKPPYSLRHYYASKLIERGENLKRIQRLWAMPKFRQRSTSTVTS